MNFLSGLTGFVWWLLVVPGPIVVLVYVIARLSAQIKLLNQVALDLQKRVKQLEKGKK